MNTIFIGVAGGTGSGKTTLTEHLAERFGSNISVVHHDNYYKRQDCSFEERCRQNYDHPDAFDTDLMIEHLKALKRGETIHCPVYDYAIHNRTDKTVEVRPTKVVIVEGILIFQNKALRDLLDIKIFVETDADVRILRRALRDVEERGRSLESVVTQYLTTVKPMHEQFVEPTRKYADIIVLEGGHNLVALDMIMQRIANHIAENRSYAVTHPWHALAAGSGLFPDAAGHRRMPYRHVLACGAAAVGGGLVLLPRLLPPLSQMAEGGAAVRRGAGAGRGAGGAGRYGSCRRRPSLRR